MTQLYLHTVPVTLAGIGKRGKVFEDRRGTYYLIAGHSPEALALCVGTSPRERTKDVPCGCGWEGVVFKCEGSCNMGIGQGGCV